MNNPTEYILKKGIKIDRISFYQIAPLIQWDRISSKNISENFIQRYINYLDAQVYPKFNKLSDNFIIRNKDIIDWVTILDTHHITKKVFDNCKTHILNILTAMNTVIR